MHRHRDHGVLAPNARLRPQVIALREGEPTMPRRSRTTRRSPPTPPKPPPPTPTPLLPLAAEALELLVAYPWPGNVRELRNVLERGLITARGCDEIDPEHLSLDLRGSRAGRAEPDPALPLAEVERRHIARALEHHDGNRSRTARSLGIGRRTLYDKLEQYD